MAMSDERKKQQAAYMKAWREKNRDRIRAYQSQWREENAEKVSNYNRAYMAEYLENPENQHKWWVRNLRKHYRLTPEAFNALWEKQNGKCLICEITMLPRGRNHDAVCVDHNHQTGEVRGLLCRACNHGIGNLKDSPEVLERAAKYLREHGDYSALTYKG